MKIWKISGIKLKDLYIKAEDFDTALAIARLQSKKYSTGQIVSEEEIPEDELLIIVTK